MFGIKTKEKRVKKKNTVYPIEKVIRHFRVSTTTVETEQGLELVHKVEFMLHLITRF